MYFSYKPYDYLCLQELLIDLLCTKENNLNKSPFFNVELLLFPISQLRHYASPLSERLHFCDHSQLTITSFFLCFPSKYESSPRGRMDFSHSYIVPRGEQTIFVYANAQKWLPLQFLLCDRHYAKHLEFMFNINLKKYYDITMSIIKDTTEA